MTNFSELGGQRKLNNRQSIRLKGYDYSQTGLYYITINIDRRRNPRWQPFGQIRNGEMILNDAGKLVIDEWVKLPQRFTNIGLHEYVVMPDHFHSIIEIIDNGNTVGEIVGAFQSIVTVGYVQGVKQHGWEKFNGRLFQRNYWEKIIQDELAYQNISNYIINNPKNWKRKG
ncbi:MAG: transposase [Schleiferiaceae bacterium]|nr:transposase [Schleiferiaceae bacterium]